MYTTNINMWETLGTNMENLPGKMWYSVSLCPLTSKEVWQCVAVCCSVVQCGAVCCSVLQCVAVCCSVLQCVAACCRKNKGKNAWENIGENKAQGKDM